MIENIQDLKSKFKAINEIGWIKSISKGSGGAGQTLEYLLNKPKDNFEIPDYNGIEIKTKNASINQFITMFNAAPDGTYMFETKRLQETYGYPDKKMKGIKVFNISVFASEATKVGSMHSFKLKVDRSSEKIFLCVFDKRNKLIDACTFWSFELLKEKLHRKMQTLAVIDASYCKNKNEVYYKYRSITFYKLKGFDSFIDAIEHGTIRITFKISSFREGKRKGQMHDHGTGFDINSQNIADLYERIYI